MIIDKERLKKRVREWVGAHEDKESVSVQACIENEAVLKTILGLIDKEDGRDKDVSKRQHYHGYPLGHVVAHLKMEEAEKKKEGEICLVDEFTNKAVAEFFEWLNRRLHRLSVASLPNQFSSADLYAHDAKKALDFAELCQWAAARLRKLEKEGEDD